MFRWYHLKCVCASACVREGASESSNYRLSLAMNNISWCSCLLRTFLLIFEVASFWRHMRERAKALLLKRSWLENWWLIYCLPFPISIGFHFQYMCVSIVICTTTSNNQRHESILLNQRLEYVTAHCVFCSFSFLFIFTRSYYDVFLSPFIGNTSFFCSHI